VGKVLETMLVARLEEHIKSMGGLSPNQHGFKKSTSTDDAVRKLRQKILASDKFCVAISLDIRNAFNTIGWTEVMSALNALDVPAYILRIFQDYFRGRTAETQAENERVEVRVTCGVPQGSVVGPLLWNIAYDRVLRLQLPLDVELLGFADDTMVIASGRSVAELEMKINEALGLVSEEISKLGLSLAVNKTEAVLFTNNYKYTNPNIILNGQTVEIKQQMKNLGMVIDWRLLFKVHTAHMRSLQESGEDSEPARAPDAQYRRPETTEKEAVRSSDTACVAERRSLLGRHARVRSLKRRANNPCPAQGTS